MSIVEKQALKTCKAIYSWHVLVILDKITIYVLVYVFVFVFIVSQGWKNLSIFTDPARRCGNHGRLMCGFFQPCLYKLVALRFVTGAAFSDCYHCQHNAHSVQYLYPSTNKVRVVNRSHFMIGWSVCLYYIGRQNASNIFVLPAKAG